MMGRPWQQIDRLTLCMAIGTAMMLGSVAVGVTGGQGVFGAPGFPGGARGPGTAVLGSREGLAVRGMTAARLSFESLLEDLTETAASLRTTTQGGIWLFAMGGWTGGFGLQHEEPGLSGERILTGAPPTATSIRPTLTDLPPPLIITS